MHYMKYFFRHGLEQEGVYVRPDGFIYLEDMLRQEVMKNLHVDLQLVQYIIKMEDNNVYELKQEGDEWLIRAAHLEEEIDESESGSEPKELFKSIDNANNNNILAKAEEEFDKNKKKMKQLKELVREMQR